MTTTPQNSFPLLTAFTTDDEMLALLTNADIVIGFALEHLDQIEWRDFFETYKAGGDRRPFLQAWRADQMAGQGDWSGHHHA